MLRMKEQWKISIWTQSLEKETIQKSLKKAGSKDSNKSDPISTLYSEGQRIDLDLWLNIAADINLRFVHSGASSRIALRNKLSVLLLPD